MEVTIARVEALKLEPGGIYVIEAQQRFRTEEDLKRCTEQLEAAGEKYGCKFLLLEPGLKIARAEIEEAVK